MQKRNDLLKLISLSLSHPLSLTLSLSLRDPGGHAGARSMPEGGRPFSIYAHLSYPSEQSPLTRLILYAPVEEEIVAR